MDLVDNDGDVIINPFNMRQAWAPAGYDQTNVVTFDFIYSFPKVKGGLDKPVLRTILNGWELSGIARSQSGQPISITANGSLQGVDAGTQYVDVVGDPYAGQNKYRWINPDAFRRPLDGEYGTFHRNALRMPGVRNLDANLVKNFAITESMKAAFRCEMFNVFNHPQIWGINTGFAGDNPGGPISTSNKNFGQATSPNQFREARNHPAGPQVQLLRIRYFLPIRKSPAALCSGAFYCHREAVAPRNPRMRPFPGSPRGRKTVAGSKNPPHAAPPAAVSGSTV